MPRGASTFVVAATASRERSVDRIRMVERNGERRAREARRTGAGVPALEPRLAARAVGATPRTSATQIPTSRADLMAPFVPPR